MDLRKLSLLLTFSGIGLFTDANAQWTVYPALSQVERVSVMHDEAYILFGNSLCLAPSDQLNDFHPFTRNEGLSDISVYDIRYSEKADKLAIVYNNGNIDLLAPDKQVVSIQDFANAAIQGDRTISRIGIIGDSLFVETGVGTLLVDMQEKLIRKTIQDLKSECNLDMSQIATNGKGYDEEMKAQLTADLDDNRNMVNNAAQMKYHDGRLYLAQSGHLYYGIYGGNGQVSILDTETGHWSQIYKEDVERKATELTPQKASRNSFRNLLSFGIDESHPSKYYIGNEGNGIFCFDNDTLQEHLLSINCPEGIQDILPDSYYSRISAIQSDKKGNLWYVCSGIDENQLHCRTAGGNFLSLPITGFTNSSAGFIDMTLSETSGYPFIWLNRTYRWNEFGGAVYYLNKTDTITSDDLSIHFSSLIDQDGNVLNPQYLYKTFEDRDGAMWLLTSSGPFVVSNQVEFFNYAEKTNTGKVTRIKIPRNDGTNLADYLLPNVATNCGLTDAANRKWIGTMDNGVYLLSEDGLEQLEHFTTDNSPLFSNAIQSLAYDPTTGNLFIACEGGICVYESDAVEGADNNNSIYCYPNPVRSNYSGKLTICGLMDDSQVRITDSAANLVHTARAAGSIVTWDLTDEEGNRVKPGVYLIYGIDADGKEGGVCKFLVQ